MSAKNYSPDKNKQFYLNLCNLLQDCVEDGNNDPLSVPPLSPLSSGGGDTKVDKKKPSENVSLADNSLLVCTVLQSASYYAIFTLPLETIIMITANRIMCSCSISCAHAIVNKQNQLALYTTNNCNHLKGMRQVCL